MTATKLSYLPGRNDPESTDVSPKYDRRFHGKEQRRKSTHFAALLFFCCWLSAISVRGLTAQSAPCGPSARSSRGREIFLEPGHFYDAPDPLPPGRPGDLIRSNPSDDYELPPRVNVIRILYHSSSSSGSNVPASGVVLFPNRKAPEAGWPILAWAHPVLGTGTNCAPSLMRNLQSGPILSMYVRLGFAVVAPDQVTLGLASSEARSDLRSRAEDLIYAVAAAKHAIPRLGQEWLAIGYEDGASIAIATAEAQTGARGSDFLGSVAVSNLNTLELNPVQQPLLVISDGVPDDSLTRQIVARMCNLGVRVEFETYAGVASGSLMGESAASQISWIKARFSGSAVPSNCR